MVQCLSKINLTFLKVKLYSLVQIKYKKLKKNLIVILVILVYYQNPSAIKFHPIFFFLYLLIHFIYFSLIFYLFFTITVP